MKTPVSIVTSFIIVVIAFAFGLAFYPHLPSLMAVHWNAVGMVNGYAPKFWGAFTLPFIMFFSGALLYAAPFLDPMRKQSTHFQKEYNRFVVFFLVFMLYVYVLSLYANLGYVFNLITFLMPALAVLWFMIGELLPKVKRNWFIGIRTPWTRGNEVVWEKTHELGGFLFQVSAFVVLMGSFFPEESFWFIIVPLIIAVIVPAVYSYMLHNQVKTRKSTHS